MADQCTADICLNEKVPSIEEKDDVIQIKTEYKTYTAKYVISTLSPHLLATSIDTPLSHDIAFTSIANKTHIWMGESIKVGLTYATPFWREKSSETIFSNVGPIPEMYDHSNAFWVNGILKWGIPLRVQRRKTRDDTEAAHQILWQSSISKNVC